jgi:hypothetical protein
MPRRDDYDDRDDDIRQPMGPLDKMYRDTNIVVLIIFSVCCSGIAFILSLIAVLTGKDPKAKSNATISLIISAILAVIGVIANVVMMSQGPRGGRF